MRAAAPTDGENRFRVEADERELARREVQGKPWMALNGKLRSAVDKVFGVSAMRFCRLRTSHNPSDALTAISMSEDAPRSQTRNCRRRTERRQATTPGC